MKENIKRLVIVTGTFLLLAGTPIIHENPLGQYLNTLTGTIEAQAAQPYSTNWETQSDGSWRYRMTDGSYATNAWIQDDVDLNWYVLDEAGTMKSGLYKSNDRYYLLSEQHDGHFGHMIKDGETYQGIVIKADTSSAYEGALSSESLKALRSLGLKTELAQDISGTKHVSKGEVTSEEVEFVVTPTQASVNTKSNMTYTEEYGWLPGSDRGGHLEVDVDTIDSTGAVRWE